MLRTTLLVRTTTRRIYHGRTHIRCFARKRFEDVEGKVDEALEKQQLESFAKKGMSMKMGAIKQLSPDEMELLNSESYAAFSDDEKDSDGEEDDDKTDANDRGGEKAPDFDAVDDVYERFANMKGRMWVEPWVLEDERFIRKVSLEDLPDWVPSMASRISQERVQLYQGGIPTLEQLASLPLPTPAPPSPGQGRGRRGRTAVVEYGKWRALQLEKYLAKKVQEKSEPAVKKILALKSWADKQDAVDILFESVEADLGEEETVLGLHPRFGEWVEKALQKYLEQVAAEADGKPAGTVKTITKESADSSSSSDSSGSDSSDSDSSDDDQQTNGVSIKTITAEEDENAVPIFVDLYNPNDVFEEEKAERTEEAPRPCHVPKILHPLAISPSDKTGRMVEEWQLSAHDTAKRIMLRQCTRTVARTLAENKSSRIYIHGSEGTGKSAVLATIVASARTSGNIVLYMPDGARLSRHGYYVEPSTTLKGFYDLPILSQEVCTEFLESHEKDLAGFSIPEALKTKHFSRNHKKLIPEEQADDLTVVGLLKLGKEIAAIAPMCFSAVMEHLMEQDEKPFLIVMDDFNCYHDYSPNDYHYFHMNYDNNVKKPIPYELITLFKPGLEAMGIFHNVDMEELPGKPKPMKRGGAVVATTESHAIGRRFTDGLTDSAHYCAKHQYWESPIKIVEVPRYSLVECEHMISHYELIGVGKLRFDRGDTVMDENEIAYLQMVSGACGQAFLDACLEG